MERSTADSIVTRQRELGQAQVVHGLANRDKEILRIPLNLSVERSIDNPLRIGFPFRCLFFETSNNPSANFFLRPTSNDSSQSSMKVSYRDAWSINGQVPQAFLHWPAQPGVTGEIVVLTDSEIRSGSQISLTAGGFSISDGATVQTIPAVTVGVASSQILAQDYSRKCVTIQNLGSASIYIGDSTVTVATGVRVQPGESVPWRNTSELWAISSAAGQDVRLMKEA